MKKLYNFLMEKYNWTPEQIDYMDFYQTLDLVFQEAEEKQKKDEAPEGYIDQFLGF